MDYRVQFSSQLQLQLKSLRKSREMTQADLARRLGVVQSRVADIERNPGAVSVEQMLQVLAMLGAQMVVRDIATEPSAAKPNRDLEAQASAQARTTVTATLTTGSKPAEPTPGAQPDSPPDDEPRGQW
jgi:HTH-type transcriptional regulator / antitoxin HipB